jgi:hypothetical protein
MFTYNERTTRKTCRQWKKLFAAMFVFLNSESRKTKERIFGTKEGFF